MDETEERFSRMPSRETIDATIEALKNRGTDAVYAGDRGDALEKVKDIMPEGSSVMTGASASLHEIGFSALLDTGRWNDLHKPILLEEDHDKRNEMRKEAEMKADFFLASINALSKNGELVACDASGSRVSAYPFAAKRIILVVGAQKITDSLEEAMERVRKYAFRLEDQRMRKAYGYGSAIAKWVIIEKELVPHRITVVLVNEKLGF